MNSNVNHTISTEVTKRTKLNRSKKVKDRVLKTRALFLLTKNLQITLALGSSLTTALHIMAFARSAYL